MSSYAANVARWNAIPMGRESTETMVGTKRSRSRSASPVIKLQGDYDSSDEDNVSLVSRSPSPTANKMDITTYDEHHPTAEKEVITIETRITSTNKGYSMLAKLGWMAGQPLGLSGNGRVDPIPFSVKNDVTGLGKRAQDERMIETTVSQRRGLDSERQIKETLQQRQFREQKVAAKEALATQIASTLKPFYCALCDKQYQTVAQYDEHTNSYAHHHKQRFRDMQVNAKGLGGGKQDKEARLAKERKREEKELKRMAKARGVKVSPIGGVIGTTSGSNASLGPEESKGFRKSGWASVSTPFPPARVQTGSGDSPSNNWTNVSDGMQPSTAEPPTRRANLGFRTAGFETLETTRLAPLPKSQDGSGIASWTDNYNHGPLPQSNSRWSNISTPAPPPPSGPPPPPTTSLPSPPPPPPPPPSTLPPPPSPSQLPPRLGPPSRYDDTRSPFFPGGPPPRNDGVSPPREVSSLSSQSPNLLHSFSPPLPGGHDERDYGGYQRQRKYR